MFGCGEYCKSSCPTRKAGGVDQTFKAMNQMRLLEAVSRSRDIMCERKVERFLVEPLSAHDIERVREGPREGGFGCLCEQGMPEVVGGRRSSGEDRTALT
jgi:hypothetical protein